MAVDLLINGTEADLDGVISMPFTQQFDDLSNPVAIKTAVSKTVTLPATPTNNQIFGNIWRIDHINGGLFDASKRVSFVLAIDGALVTTGYIKLNTIKYVRGVPRSYEIHLFGGLGDFFYELEAKGLKNVVFDGNNLQHTINTDAIVTPPDNLKYFLSYQGKYKSFDSGTEYTGNTENPFTELLQEEDEHERQEFRSYYQRPAVKMSAMLENIFNQSEYQINVSDAFKATPYWKDTYLALTTPESENATLDYVATFKGREQINNEIPFGDDYKAQIRIVTTGANTNAMEFKAGDNDMFDLVNGLIHAGRTPEAKGVDINIYFQAGFVGELKAEARYRFLWPAGSRKIEFAVRLVNVETGEVIGSLPYTWTNGDLGYDTYGIKGWPRTIRQVMRDGDTQGKNVFQISGSMFIPAGVNDVRVECFTYTPENLHSSPSRTEPVLNARGKAWADSRVALYYAINEAASSITVRSATSIRSESVVNYTTYIPEGYTQLDLVKNYAKAFGLLWEKNPFEKIINVRTRNEYFEGYTIEDWTEKVDISKDITVTPLTFDYRYGILAWGEASTERAKQYKSTYNNEYGAMKLDTGYEFDASEETLLEDTTITNGLISMEYDYFFNGRNPAYPNRDDKEIPAIFEQKGTSRERCDDVLQLFFWAGWRDCKPYRLTDDVPDMAANGNYCWIKDGINPPDANIKNMTQYPAMARKIYDRGQYWSLDFGKPSLTYYPTTDETYPTTATIYERFWSNFMRERLNSDTRIMTCYVNLTPAEYASWKFNKFVIIKNTLWHVNKIQDFDMMKRQSTKCELVRVNDITAYINGQNY